MDVSESLWTVKQSICKQQVGGSTPPVGSTRTRSTARDGAWGGHFMPSPRAVLTATLTATDGSPPPSACRLQEGLHARGRLVLQRRDDVRVGVHRHPDLVVPQRLHDHPQRD